jgi:hypothetical protein
MGNDKKEEIEEIILTLVGYVEGATIDYTSIDFKLVPPPNRVTLHTNIPVEGVTSSDLEVINRLIQRRRLCFKISIATEEDELLISTKKRLLKNE